MKWLDRIMEFFDGPPVIIQIAPPFKPGEIIPIYHSQYNPGVIIIMEKPIVILESPFRGKDKEDRLANVAYARKAAADCAARGELAFASHLLFPQFLDEDKPEDRELGISAGYRFWPLASKVVFYVDRGWSNGMKEALVKCAIDNKPYEIRHLADH